jgi:hypothetical protein
MANKRDINDLIKDHEKRIARLESLVLRQKTVKPSNEKQNLPDHILNLRTKGFFSQSKTATETHQKLKGTYHCEIDRVAMALLRLAERKQLRKASKIVGKKKYQTYVW